MSKRPSKRSNGHAPDHNIEQRALLEQIKQVAQGIGETFTPFCEVVVHDLLHPRHAILAIHNNLSGRAVGDPVTELGLARIADSQYPQIIANYANRFADGRQAKSTSIGIKDSSGRYIAALCMNVDITLLNSLQNILSQFSNQGRGPAVAESLEPSGSKAINAHIDQFAARYATTPVSLKPKERRLLMQELKEAGYMEVRRAIEIVAQCLGVSRATVYMDAK